MPGRVERRRSSMTNQDQTWSASGATSPRVSIRGLTKRFRTRHGDHLALDNVSLDLGAGEYLVLLGPSGCGKTTLLRCVAGLETPDEGEIVVNGQVVFSSRQGVWLPPEKRKLSMVFQSYALWPHMSVFENIAYPLRNLRWPQKDIQDSVSAVLQLVGLEHLAKSHPGQLSGGQQQRVALARAIVWKADLILFDEPLSNLDAKVRERLRVELLGLQSRLKFSALYVTHDQTEAMALADRIVIMGEGRIVQVGKPLEIYCAPQSRYVADFVGSANEIEGVVTAVLDEHVDVRTRVAMFAATPGGSETMTVGQTVTLVFRPQHCLRTPATGELNRLTGKLVHSQFLGVHTERLIEVDGWTMTLTESSEEAIATGAAVEFNISADRVRAFPVAAQGESRGVVA